MPKQKEQKQSLYTMVNSLGETPNYFLYVGVLPQGVGDYDGEHYLLVNKDTDVIEVETRILAKAYEFLEQLQAALDMHFQDKPEEGLIGKQEGVVPIGKYSH